MLEFDPTKRITVDQALRHSFLADFHTPGMEASADRPLDAELELLGEAPENLRATVRHPDTALHYHQSVLRSILYLSLTPFNFSA
jgi:hypothetical protein